VTRSRCVVRRACSEASKPDWIRRALGYRLPTKAQAPATHDTPPTPASQGVVNRASRVGGTRGCIPLKFSVRLAIGGLLSASGSGWE
jgi:hypothetical protein